MTDPAVIPVARAMGVVVSSTTVLAGGFSHRTLLAETDAGPLVMRFGGPAAPVEAAVMRLASDVVPVPEVRFAQDGCLVTEYLPGILLDRALSDGVDLSGLGQAVSESLSRVGLVELPHPGFFRDATLSVAPQPPWSVLLPRVAAQCMRDQHRLDAQEQRGWLALCERAVPALEAVDCQARLVHGDANPKNVLVQRVGDCWQVAAWLDWEFAHSGCPYADAANMLRFTEDYPPDFVDGFTQAYAADRSDWLDLGRAFDLFSLSQLLTRAVGHPIGDRVEVLVRRMLAAAQR